MSVVDSDGFIGKLNLWCMEYILTESPGTVCIDHGEQNDKVAGWPIYVQ